MNWINTPQMIGIAERVAAVSVTWLVATGRVPFLAGHEKEVSDWIGAVIIAGVTLWGWHANTPASLAAKTASLPEVKKVVTTEAVKKDADTPGVVTK